VPRSKNDSRKYIGKTPKELDKLTTEWLKRHDKRPKESHDNSGPAIEWDISPVSAEVDEDDDEDAHEIARTFAELSGGDRAFDFYAALAVEDARGLEARREYMQRTRTSNPSKRREWREREKFARRRKRAALLEAAAREAAHQQRRESRTPQRLGKRPRQKYDARQLAFAWVDR